MHRLRLIALLLGVVVVAACGSDTGASSDGAATTVVPSTAAPSTTPPSSTVPPDADDVADPDAFPAVIDATAEADGDGTWRFSVTISSPYDTPERYADAWRVLGPDGSEYGIRVLTHDHANEQPFTRSQSGIAVPAAVDTVTIQGRDLVNGWGGPTFDLTLPEPAE